MTQPMQISKIKNTRKLTPDDIRKMKEKDHKMVKGIFRCYEPKGGSFTFSFKKYPGDLTITTTMVDGETYEVPLMIAKHLNQNCAYYKHSYVLDADGKPTIDRGKKIKRCSFESLEFNMGDDELTS